MKKIFIIGAALFFLYSISKNNNNNVDEGTDPNDNGGDISPEVPGEESPVNPYDGKLSPDKAKDKSGTGSGGSRLNPGGGGGPLPVLGPMLK